MEIEMKPNKPNDFLEKELPLKKTSKEKSSAKLVLSKLIQEPSESDPL
jgi:hypothetical protein